MSKSFPMNGGDGTCSYTNNSTVQRDGLSAMRDVIKEVVINNLDIDLGCTKFAIADLGCSVGPNTFYAVQTLIEAVQQKYDQESGRANSDKLEFQVLFNDQSDNDFNTLFTSLPQPRNYLAAAVPGSFHGRLFPSSSIHIAYTSYSLHWLSKVPDELRLKDSPAWNPGRVHYTGAPDAVVKAYEVQFEEDMEAFLRARSQEIAPGGMVVIIMMGIPSRDTQHLGFKLYNFIETILMDMVKEGVLEREKMDSFNIPMFYPSIEDMSSIIVEKNKCFEIVKIEAVDVMANAKAPDLKSVIMHCRAMLEGNIINHFGNEIADQLFVRAMQQQKMMELARILNSKVMDFTGILFAVLKRKLL